jgi:hypothetical protein
MVIYLIFFVVIGAIAGLSTFTSKVDARILEFGLFFCIFLFVGMRTDVGTDYETYQLIFKEIQRYGETTFHVETGFYLINYWVVVLNGGFVWVNIICAAISSVFLFKAINFFLDDSEYKWLSYISFLSIGIFFVYYLSGIRQGVSLSVFLYAIRFIYRKKFIYYAFFIFIGALFHTSIVLMIFVYLIPRKPINKLFVLPLVIISVVMAYAGLTDKFFQYSINFLSGHYAAYKDLFSGFANTKTGFGILIRVLLGIICILLSDGWIKNDKDALVYNIFCLGLIAYSFFLGVDILIRISEYLMDTMIFILPLAAKAFNKKERVLYVSAMLVFLMALYYSNLSFVGMKLIPYKIASIW